MGHGLMARAQATLARLHAQRGQGTVEYVGLILLLAVVLAGVVAAAQGFSDDKDIANTVVKELKDAISSVGEAND